MPEKRDIVSTSIEVPHPTRGNIAFPVTFYPDARDEATLRANRARLKLEDACPGVLVIYTGGTIGSAPSNPAEPDSPQVVKKWPVLFAAVPALASEDSAAINFAVDAVAFDNPLDSSNVGPTEWAAMATLIETYQHDYEGFVVAHGTDTLVYTASALSFMCENLSKPIILTGSQLSAIGHIRNDAQQNLITAILIANPKYSRIPTVPEVCIFFRDKLLRGNRTKKVDAEGYAAFDSLNYDVLGEAGAQIVIHAERLRPAADPDSNIVVWNDLNRKVIALDVFPGIQETELLRRICDPATVKGVVLKTYGTGNTSTAPEFLQQIREATEQEILFLNVTQCPQGAVVMGLYETSDKLVDCEVCGGDDITAEAALCKLMVLLGARSEGLDYSGIQTEVQKAWAGEQSHSFRVVRGEQEGVQGVDQGAPRRRTKALAIKTVKFSRALLRFRGTKLETGASDSGAIRIYIDLGDKETPSDASPKFAGRFPMPKSTDPEEKTVSFEITKAARSIFKDDRPSSFTVVMEDCDGGSFTWRHVELVLSEQVQ
jgi:L-asparaginase